MSTRTSSPDRRTLPLLAADAVEVPWVIAEMGEQLQQDTSWEAHSHPTHELLWNERGASTAMVGARRWTITHAHGLWIPAGVVHTGVASAGTHYRAAQFRARSVRPIADVPVAVAITPLLRLLLERLQDEALPAGSRAVTEAMVLDVLAPAPHEVALTVPPSRLLQPVVAAVLRDPRERRTLADWSDELGVHPRTVTREFRRHTGLGFAQWVTAARVQEAVALLADGVDVGEVARCTGFSSATAFGAAFRRVTGLRPSEYRPGGGPAGVRSDGTGGSST